MSCLLMILDPNSGAAAYLSNLMREEVYAVLSPMEVEGFHLMRIGVDLLVYQELQWVRLHLDTFLLVFFHREG